ncbi:hypothetical protein DEO72_LG10g1711 [Vigna unguiculata]|uniref:Uncharacterized protein n=1 Tax=Vigna unguiculata TaxID=3917 RepID=A0A4D6NC69_VIGUN|nr:hypothetical protein DEO72_LG10g1711 [Vigna unguiculata]
MLDLCSLSSQAWLERPPLQHPGPPLTTLIASLVFSQTTATKTAIVPSLPRTGDTAGDTSLALSFFTSTWLNPNTSSHMIRIGETPSRCYQIHLQHHLLPVLRARSSPNTSK